jgi:hypothetical protein
MPNAYVFPPSGDPHIAVIPDKVGMLVGESVWVEYKEVARISKGDWIASMMFVMHEAGLLMGLPRNVHIPAYVGTVALIVRVRNEKTDTEMWVDYDLLMKGTVTDLITAHLDVVAFHTHLDQKMYAAITDSDGKVDPSAYIAFKISADDKAHKDDLQTRLCNIAFDKSKLRAWVASRR